MHSQDDITKTKPKLANLISMTKKIQKEVGEFVEEPDSGGQSPQAEGSEIGEDINEELDEDVISDEDEDEE